MNYERCKYNRPKHSIDVVDVEDVLSVETLQGDQNSTTTSKQQAGIFYKGSDATRFVDYTFGSVETGSLTVTGNTMFAGIAMGNPADGGTVQIPQNITTVILQSIYPYTALTISMPMKPQYGQIVIIICTVNVTTLSLTNGTFGTTVPTSITAPKPLRFIFAGSWFNF